MCVNRVNVNTTYATTGTVTARSEYTHLTWRQAAHDGYPVESYDLLIFSQQQAARRAVTLFHEVSSSHVDSSETRWVSRVQ